ncbi:MAG: hypothetical protein WCU80_08095 [Paludibacteraceae bacterium]|nr:hypothetical protein [Prevotellaceae bacterium]
MKRYKYALLVISITSALLFQANAVENTEKAKSIEEDSTTTESTNAFDYILVERNGGGDKLFSLSKGEGDYYIAYFARYNFKDTTLRIDLKIKDLGDTLSNAIDNILLGESSLMETDTIANAKGFLIGSWLRSYAVNDTIKTEIKNRDLLSAIASIENRIESKISSPATGK